MSVSVIAIRILGAAAFVVGCFFTDLCWRSRGTTVGHDLFAGIPIALGVGIVGLGLLFLQRWAAAISGLVIMLLMMGTVSTGFLKEGPPIWAVLVSLFFWAIPATILMRGWKVLR